MWVDLCTKFSVRVESNLSENFSESMQAATEVEREKFHRNALKLFDSLSENQ